MVPLVSVVIPAYNCAAYIDRTIDSVWNQNDSNIEIIVVDDGSTDATAEVLARYGDRIRVHRQENQGVAAARNQALALARGSWIAFLDADDAWRPHRLNVGRLAQSRWSDAALIFSSFRLVDPDDACLVGDAITSYYRVFDRYKLRWAEILEPATPLSWGSGSCGAHIGDGFASLFLGNFIKTSTVLVRRSALDSVGVFDTSLSTEEDYDLWLRLAKRYAMVYVDAPLVDVRRRPDQLTSAETALIVATNAVRVVSHTAENASSRIEPALMRRRLADANRSLARIAIVAGEPRKARDAALASLRHAGLHPESVAILASSFVPGPLTVRLGHAWRRLRRAIK